MGFLSSLKKVTAAVSTGGLSLLAPKPVQEQLGTAIGVGTAAAFAAPVIGSALSGLGTTSATAAGGATPGAGGIGGLLSGFKNAGSFLTAGTQLLGGGIGSLLNKAGLPSGIPGLPVAPPPNAGGAPTDSAGAPTRFLQTGGGRRVPLSAPYSGQAGLVPGSPGGFGSAVASQLGGGFMPVGFGDSGQLMDDSGNVIPAASPDFPGGMAMPIPAAGLGVVRGGSRSLVALAAKAMRLTELLGPIGAAAALGLGAADLARLVFLALTKKKKKRHRGISARDMRVARRTIGKVERAHMQLEHAYGRAVHRYAGRRRARATGARGQVIEMIKQ